MCSVATETDFIFTIKQPPFCLLYPNTEYFGEPIYTYSLKQGIDDGFLAPYKVVKVTLDIDAEGWRPPKGFLDKDGNPIIDVDGEEIDFPETPEYPEITGGGDIIEETKNENTC